MSTTAATTVTSLDGFHATPTAQRADELGIRGATAGVGGLLLAAGAGRYP